MGYKEIYDKYQEQYEISNRLIFANILDILKKETKIDIPRLAILYQVDISDTAKEFYFFKWVLFNFYRRFIPYFYEVLEQFGYDMFSEVIDTMNLIGKDTHNFVDPDVINYAKISPYIDEVTVDKSGLVTINSEDLGDFSFYPTRIYLRDNKGAVDKLNNYKTAGFCHQMSWELMSHLDKCALITSLLPTYFEGTHYHTVLRDDKGLVVDSAIEAVYTEDTRDMLFKANDICITEKENTESKLKLAIEAEDEESKQIDFPNAMLLTLYEQSKVLR